MKFTVSYQTFT